MTGVVLNLLLFAGKWFAGQISGSVSVMADAFNNLTDAGTVLAASLGLKMAEMGPGKNHPDGHGRLEWIISLVAGVIVFQTGFSLLQQTIREILNPADTTFSLLTLAILSVSIAVKITLWLYYSRRAKKQDALSMKAIALDSLCDAFSTGTVLLSVLLNHFCGLQLDGWFGLGVAAFILYNSALNMAQAASRLMGKAAEPQEIQALITAVGQSCPAVGNLYEVQIEDCGCGHRKAFLCISPAAGVPVAELVRVVPALRAAIEARFGYEVFIQTESTLSLSEQENQYHCFCDAIHQIDCTCRIDDFRVSRWNGVRQIRAVLTVAYEDRGKMPQLQGLICKPQSYGMAKDIVIAAKVHIEQMKKLPQPQLPRMGKAA